MQHSSFFVCFLNIGLGFQRIRLGKKEKEPLASILLQLGGKETKARHNLKMVLTLLLTHPTSAFYPFVYRVVDDAFGNMKNVINNRVSQCSCTLASSLLGFIDVIPQGNLGITF